MNYNKHLLDTYIKSNYFIDDYKIIGNNVVKKLIKKPQSNN